MKNNKVLIYDDACPLCAWYTGVFVKYGLLGTTGRKPFSDIAQYDLQNIDMDRACNEIPLLNTDTHEILYGIDAMVEVLNDKFPFVKPIAKWAPVNYFLRKLYKLISYNRKGIVARVPQVGKFNCAPSYSFDYKKIFIVACFLFSSVMLLVAYKPLFNSLTDIVMLAIGLLAIGGVLLKNKNALEAIMQIELQISIATVLLLPVVFFMPISNTAALIYLAVVGIYILKLFWVRLGYLKYYFNADK
jgi:DCC1-like thiol-disulfide oxidoreductase